MPENEEWCPCGHGHPDLWRCIAGRIYGPCSDPNCGGVCEWTGDCTAPDCACKEEDD